jgi:hypothetical protein
VIAVALSLGLLAVNLLLLYRLGQREARSLSEYAQHLMLSPDAYEDQRAKFLAYLASTTSMSSATRTTDAAAALTRMAVDMRAQVMRSNAAARKAVALGQGAPPPSSDRHNAAEEQGHGGDA